MTKRNTTAEIKKKLVVAFDICSSTTIIEDLHKTENTIKWRDFLIWIKEYLRIKSTKYNFVVYKFTGDGWILLFDYNCKGDDLVNFLQNFCSQFKIRHKKYIEDFLETPPLLSGLTFGIDRGSLIGFHMNEQKEYVGRSINVACRLQSSIKDKDDSPQYKALITKALYQSIKNSFNDLRVQSAKRKLRNIGDGKDIHCMKVFLESL